MNESKRRLHRVQFPAIMFILVSLFTACGVKSSLNPVRVENDIFVKSFICESSHPGVIRSEYQIKKSERILNLDGSPYFEFVINGEVVSSEDRVWVFKEKIERPMQNGGTEYTLEFAGAAGNVDGLLIDIKQQVFPGSTLIREKLVLHSGNKEFALNKVEGRLHFIFPQYRLRLSNGENPESTEIRMASWEKRPPDFSQKKSGNHMYYPAITVLPLSDLPTLHKGPIHLLSSDNLSWLTSYEHASQDNINGLLDEDKMGAGNLINDAMQGTKGVFTFPLKDEDFLFLGIRTKKKVNGIDISVEACRGAYLEGELIKPDHPYESVWAATAFYEQDSLELGKELIREYLFNQICENPVSREPEFYYNTWGMQRENPSRPLRDILTYERIFEEIEYAAQLGVDIFVLDDGWEQTQGIWKPHHQRLPEGLMPIREKLDEYGIKMGLWFSPMGIDSSTSRYREHPEWVIRDSEAKPIQAQWGHPAFDFVSDFFDLFIEDCKILIDQGCRFMKFDAINTFYSTLTDLHHGTDLHSPEEIRARYEYLLPIYVVKAMEVLTDYEPGLIIEIDLTEARRVMTGLAPLSQGKLFFMNNGASSYNDYSTFRSKSMRTIANEYAGLIPLELFTYANYPHNLTGAMEYNVNNSILAGHGFWGDLSLMTEAQRAFVGARVSLSKRVLPFISQTVPIIKGKVGDSPEIYSIINNEKAAGQVISFSQEPSEFSFEQELRTAGLLAVLNHAYDARDNMLRMNMKFREMESTSAVFILPNEETGISIVSSTSSLRDAVTDQQTLTFEVSEPGSQIILWPMELGEPVLSSESEIEYQIVKKARSYHVQAHVIDRSGARIRVEPTKNVVETN